MADLREVYVNGSSESAWLINNRFFVRAMLPGNVQQIKMKVWMCCAKCEEKVKEEIFEVDGVVNVVASRMKSKVTVIYTGYVDPFRVLKKAKKVHKKAEILSLKVASESSSDEDDSDEDGYQGAEYSSRNDVNSFSLGECRPCLVYPSNQYGPSSGSIYTASYPYYT